MNVRAQQKGTIGQRHRSAAQKCGTDVTRDVLDELLWNPGVGVSDLDVEVNSGNVTLSGTTAT